MSRSARIVGAGESLYQRRPGQLTAMDVLSDAAGLALSDAGVAPDDVDGLGVSSFTLAPDRAIDLAVRLGLRTRWLMDGGTGGASGIDMLQHARHAVEAGDARCVLLVAGDALNAAGYRALTNAYNAARRDHLAPIPHGGANSIFALLTQRHMHACGLTRAAYGAVVVSQRVWAAGNPNAAYRDRLSIEEYLNAQMVSDPLSIFDCVPLVAGADALVVARGGDGVRVGTLAVNHNADRHEGDGLRTGLAQIAEEFWKAADASPDDMDVVSIYDDYPALVLIQLADLGFGEPDELIEKITERRLALNTSGGQLSAGQAGAAGGMHGLVELVRQLRGEAGERQVRDVRRALATGYGMVAYRYGACANVVVLEGS